MTTGYDDALTRIAANEARLIPHGGQLPEEILHLLWLGVVALGFVSQMLQGTLVEYGEGQLVGIGGDMRVLGVAKGTRGEIHRTYDVAGKGQRGVVPSFRPP